MLTAPFFTMRLFQTYLVSENLSVVECPSHHTKITSERCTASRLLFGPVLPLCPLATRSSLPRTTINTSQRVLVYLQQLFLNTVCFFVCWQKKTYDWLQAHGVTDDVYTHWQMWIFRDLPFTHLVSTCTSWYITHRQCACSGVCGQLALDTPPATDTVLS